MLRRTFAKTLLGLCSIPFWPFTEAKKKLSNSELIAKLLQERKDFSLLDKDGNVIVNIVRRRPYKRRITKQVIQTVKDPFRICPKCNNTNSSCHRKNHGKPCDAPVNRYAKLYIKHQGDTNG